MSGGDRGGDAATLALRIVEAVKDYRRVFPEPHSLAPNLSLAVEAMPFLVAATVPPAAAAVPDRAAPTEHVWLDVDTEQVKGTVCRRCGRVLPLGQREDTHCPAAPTEGAGEGALDALFRYLTGQGSQTESMARVVDRALAELDALRDTVRRGPDLASVEGWACVEAEKHQAEKGGGCTCGFVAWSAEHVVVMVWHDRLLPMVREAYHDLARAALVPPSPGEPQ